MSTDFSFIPSRQSPTGHDRKKSQFETRTRYLPLPSTVQGACTASICWDEHVTSSPSGASRNQAESGEFVPSTVRIVGEVPKDLRRVYEAQIQVPLSCNEHHIANKQISERLQWDFDSHPFVSHQSHIVELSWEDTTWALKTAIETRSERYKSQYDRMTDWILTSLGPTKEEYMTIKEGQKGFEDDMDVWKAYMVSTMKLLLKEGSVDKDTAVSVFCEFVESRGDSGRGERVQICRVAEEIAWI